MNKKIFIIGLLALLDLTATAPSGSTENSFVVVTDKTTSNDGEVKSDKPLSVPKIYEMKVTSNVTNRFAKTEVCSKVKNLAEKSQEAVFAVVLPDSAYITGFIMEIDGKSYEAYIKEKEEAKDIYDKAVAGGIGAGHVAVSARDSNKFTVSVNVEPESKAVFYLTYEELLQRQNGQYEIVLNIHPGQPVKDLDVQVNINETRPLTFVKTPSIRSGNEIPKEDENLDPKSQVEIINSTSAKVRFAPNIERQKQFAHGLGTQEDQGLAGQFVVQYDVERDPTGGEVLVSDGYFVHFFAPSDVKPLKKHVIFILDTSGSMYGTRIQQLKQAMKSILPQLQKDDTFNIVDFNTNVNVWNIPKAEVQYVEKEKKKLWLGDDYYTTEDQTDANQTLPGPFKVTPENIEQAQKVVDKLEANGGTNIQAALEVGLRLVNKTDTKETNENQPIVVFLTDGEATVGETIGDDIISIVGAENDYHVPIFSLSFGDGADRAFLEKLSLNNNAFARHIYESADAALQLEAFYKYISSPLLSDVHFKYVSKKFDKVTKSVFPILFDGSEIIVAGEYIEDLSTPSDIDPGFIDNFKIGSVGQGGPIDFVPKVERPQGSLERHWAYLTVKQLLDDRDASKNKTIYDKKILDLALKYHFVTPVSSLVVVKPNATAAETSVEDASKTDSFGVSSLHQQKFAMVGGAAGFPAPALPFNAAPSFGGGAVPASGVFYQQASLEEAEIDTVDRLDADYPSTPLIVSSTQTPTSNVQLATSLPWLAEILSGIGTISLPSGRFKIGENETVSLTPECSNSPQGQNVTGVCTLLHDCPESFSYLSDLQTYTKYFCPLEKYAGVCCVKTLPAP